MAKSIDLEVDAAGNLTRLKLSAEATTALGVAMEAVGNAATGAIRTADGNINIPISDDVLARLNRLRRPGENDNDVIQRVLLAQHDEETEKMLAEIRAGVKPAAPAKPAPAKPHGVAFATFFEAFRASLADTKRMKPYYPVDALDGAQRPVFDRACRDLLPVMHRAHRIVLEDDFCALARALTELSPAHLLAALATARLPYETMWLEWNSLAGPFSDADKVGVSQAGFLIAPSAGRHRAIIAANVEHRETPGVFAAVPNMIGFTFDFREPWVDWSVVVDAGNHMMPFDTALFGDVPGAVEAIRSAPWGGEGKTPADRAAIGRFIRHAAYHPAPPLGSLMWATIRHAMNEGAEDVLARQREWFMQNVMATRGLFKWLTAVLALLAHLPDRDVDKRPAKAPGHLVRGRIVPGYHYNVVTLRRPLNVRRVASAIRRENIARGPSPQYDVGGGWRYRRGRGDPKCSHVWARRYDEEGNPVGKDQQLCKRCDRLRWRVKDYKRGDPRYGVIERGERVTAAPPPEHRVE
jgi:hypothetical protein